VNEAGSRRLHALQTAMARTATSASGERLGYANSRQLLLSVRAELNAAVDAERLRTSSHELSQLVKLLTPRQALSSQDQQELAGALSESAAVLLVGGVPASTDFHRSSRQHHIVRADGVSFTGRWILCSQANGVEVLAYGAELWWCDFDKTTAVDRWIRWDMNVSGHPNDLRGVRAHMHVGSDDWSLPSPVFRPLELLTVLLYAGTELTRDDP
jgi:hypothetical protein